MFVESVLKSSRKELASESTSIQLKWVALTYQPLLTLFTLPNFN